MVLESFRAFHKRLSTFRNYSSSLEKFFLWAESNNCNPLEAEASVRQVSAFLMSLFKEGRQVSTIRNYRSALAAIHKG
ncbi:site-specific integrase, partial [Salmonella sp. s51884]|uniref:site-specific integrase n=1 Tax=Salmonella sp. s51884 TaxID=3159654 RepID=UPI0039805718